jgi:signal recognition particle receptor subunit beta
MEVADTESGVVTLRVVYYGPPGAGKTTNLERVSALIHGNQSGRITPRQAGENRIASLEIPLGSLRGLTGSSVVVRLETMQGEVSSAEGGWSQALANADGIVFVADSSPHARTANLKALAGIRERIEGRGRSAAAIPVLLQWNKRDLADARPIAEMETELNHRCFPSIEAASRSGTGVPETLIAILKRTIDAAHRKALGTARMEAELGQAVTAAIQRLSQSAREAAIDRFGMTIDRQSSAWPHVRESPRLYGDGEGGGSSEVVYSAESTGQGTSASRMLAALERATCRLHDENLSGPPRGLMAGLLAGCDRTHGSLLLFRQGSQRMEECEVVPTGSDPLNAPQLATGGLTAATLCSGHEPAFFADLADEVFLDSVVPGTEHLKAAWVVPLILGSVTYGGMVVYVTDSEHSPIDAERAYWRTAGTLTSVYLAWQAARNRAIASRRTGAASRPDEIEQPER